MLEELLKKECVYNFAQKITNAKLKEAIQDYSLHYLSPEKEVDFFQYQYKEISTNLKNSTVLIIDKFQNPEVVTDEYFLLCFKKTIIVIEQPNISFIIHPLLKINDKIEFFFLNNTKEFFDDDIIIHSKELNDNDLFYSELYAFRSCFQIPRSENALYSKICRIICPCLSAYFIKEGYNKSNTNRITDFCANKDKPT